MATDYDEPRSVPDETADESLDALQTQRNAAAVIDLEEDDDTAESLELPGADLSNEELLIQLVPQQDDEFTCMSCFLIHHRSQLAREHNGEKFCTECEA